MTVIYSCPHFRNVKHLNINFGLSRLFYFWNAKLFVLLQDNNHLKSRESLVIKYHTPQLLVKLLFHFASSLNLHKLHIYIQTLWFIFKSLTVNAGPSFIIRSDAGFTSTALFKTLCTFYLRIMYFSGLRKIHKM